MVECDERLAVLCRSFCLLEVHATVASGGLLLCKAAAAAAANEMAPVALLLDQLEVSQRYTNAGPPWPPLRHTDHQWFER